MKFHKRYLLPFGFLFFFLAGVAFASSSQFFAQAQKYINTNCSRKYIDNQTALLCYLFNKVGEHDSSIANINTTISPIHSEITDLQKRVTALENQLTVTPTPYFFDDEFNDTNVNTSIWTVYPNSGTYSESGGNVNLPGGIATNMPLFETTNNPFPTTGKFTITYGIQYSTIQGAGDGLALNIGQQPNNSTSPNNAVIAIWQDNSNGLIFTSYGTILKLLGTNDTNYHTIKITYDGSVYSLYEDNTLEYTTSPLARPTNIWFGHPLFGNGNWTGFNLDYIRVTQP